MQTDRSNNVTHNKSKVFHVDILIFFVNLSRSVDGGMVGPGYMSRATSGGFLYRLSRNAEHGVCLSGTANSMLGCVVRG